MRESSPTAYSWVPLRALRSWCPAILPGPSCRNIVPSRVAGSKTRRAGRSAALSRGGVRQRPHEAQQLPDSLLAVRVLAYPQREVVGGDRTQVPVIGFAVLVAAVRGLQFQVGQHD